MWPVTAKVGRVRTGTPPGGDGGGDGGEGIGASPWGLPGRPRGLGALGGRLEGCAALGDGLVSASRFLKSAILIREKKFKTRTLGRMWRAGLCNWVGGSMKGEEKRAARAAKAPASSGAARGGVSYRSASPPPLAAGPELHPGRPPSRGGAIEGVRVLAASRFLKSAIVNREEKFKTRTLGRMWRASLCIWPGGSMKGGERHRRLQGRRRLGRMSG